MSSLYASESVDATRRAEACACYAHRFGNAYDRPARARAYPTDLTDAQWQRLIPVIPVPAWMCGRGGQPEGYCHRVMIDAVFYVLDNGIKWRAMPRDFPHRGLPVLPPVARPGPVEGPARPAAPGMPGEGRAHPGAERRGHRRAVAARGRDRGQGAARLDGGKAVQGTKRHIAVDAIGILLAVLVTPADVQDRDGALPLLERLCAACLRIALVWADGGYAGWFRYRFR